jgi:demethylmenaquinone methyltransferase/2-methoxy-6-polyprenyl-1,4-benzoquinol methylase
MKMKKTLRKVLAKYDNSAPFYDLMNSLYFFGKDKRFRSILIKKSNPKPGDIVLDLCCGTGLDFPFLLKRIGMHGTLLGVDGSSEMLRQLKKKRLGGNLNLIRSDAAHIPLRDKILNVILVSFCLRITPELDTVLEEVTRVLKSDGRLAVLANSKPTGILRILGIVVTRLISLRCKVNFEIDLNEYISRRFRILEDRKMLGGLVQLLIGKTRTHLKNYQK